MKLKTTHNIIPVIITSVILMLSTAMALETCYKFKLDIAWAILLVPAYDAVCRLCYAGCNKLAGRIIKPFAKAHDNMIERKQKEAVTEALAKVEKTVIIREPISDETLRVQDQYIAEASILKEKMERDEAEKLDKILAYTRGMFLPLGFDENELSQILNCVRYFALHKSVLKSDALNLRKRDNVTQASLKNFTWNIANQYSIDRDTAALFAKITFAEWFYNTELSSIKKTLRNPTGRHAIEIDENILKKIIRFNPHISSYF